MFVFLPLGVEGGEVRFPVVGASILALCVALFVVTWVVVPDPMGKDPQTAHEAVQYLVEHPYLEVPKDFAKHFLPEGALQQLGTLKQAWLAENELPSSEVVADQQAELERLALAAVAAIQPTLFTRLALVKSRGLAQPGWLTHMFLHFGWLHLIGNMLFLYAVALLLEDAWGRGLFLAFYLVGGLVSAVAEYAMHAADSAMVMAGASGAVSACIGAAVVRFATRRMRLGYFLFLGFFVRTGTFAVPVWLWGLFKAGGEVLDLALGATAGVAVMAHVAGLGFGAVVALVMRGAGLDKRFVATDEVVDPYRPEVVPEVLEAQGLLARGQVAEARAQLEAARRKHPDDVDVMWGLMGVELQEGRKPQAAAWLERLVQALLRTGHRELAAQRVTSAWPSFTAEDVRPSFAWQLVRTFGDDGLPRNLLRELAKQAGSERSAVSVPALVKAAELALEARDLDDAAECIYRARAGGRLPKELAARLDELAARVGPRANATLPRDEPVPGAALLDDTTSLAVAPLEEDVPVRVARQRHTFRASVLAVRSGALELSLSNGAQRAIPLSELKAVGAGLVLAAGERKVLVILLLLREGDGSSPALLVHLDSDGGGVERLRPGVPPATAYLEFLRWLLANSPARAVPGRAQLESAQLGLFADAAALELSLFPP